VRRAGRRAGPVSPAVVAVVLALSAAACSNHKLTSAEARRLIENSPRFTAPDVLRVRARYCSTIDAPADNPGSGLARLKALEGTGAIRIEHRAAAPGECASAAGPMREWLVLALTDTGRSFHPQALPGGDGWEFTLARRRFISLQEVTFNRDSDPTIARAAYRWAWKTELLGQLLQTSEDPVNAQASFIRPEGQWELRDVGF
jgi:hypothetical protein